MNSSPTGDSALVIGGLGFLGSNLTGSLAAAGTRLTLLTPSRERHAAQAARFESVGVHVVEGDIRNHELMAHLVRGKDVIFNLSGQSGAVRSMNDPWTDLDVNCRGTLVLLEAIREAGSTAKVVLAGSRLQYGRTSRLPANESEGGDATCLHAVHKSTAENYLRLYGELFGVRFVVARITNPFGPGQPVGRTAYGVVNHLIHQALAGDILTIYGDGQQRRDYIHVDDVVSALVALAASVTTDRRVYNVGSGVGTRMIDLARLIIEIAGGGRIEHVDWPLLAQQVETGDFVADISRIKREIAWTPAVPLREGLERTVAAYRQQPAPKHQAVVRGRGDS